MRLWAGHSTHFIRDTTHNQIAEKLRAAFFHHYRYDPPRSEVNVCFLDKDTERFVRSRIES